MNTVQPILTDEDKLDESKVRMLKGYRDIRREKTHPSYNLDQINGYNSPDP